MTKPIRIAFGLVLLSCAATAQQYVISTFAGGAAQATPTVATDAAIGTPFGVATDSALNAYFASPDVHSVFKLSQNGVLIRVAGNSRPGYSGDGGPSVSALLNSPRSVAVDGAGNLFIADTGNNRVRRVSPSGFITTVAGIGTPGFSGDGGPAANAQLSVSAVAADSAGNLFIGGGYRVRKVSPNGIITTVAGNGDYYFSGDGGPAINAALVAEAVAVDRSGNLFIADSIHVRKVSPDGIITTVAGNGTEGFSGDGGPATGAPLRAWGVAVDDAGTLFIANLCSIRKVTSDGIITTVAGICSGGPFAGDGGPATSAHLTGAFGVALDGAGKLFIADASNYRIRQVSSSGIITTVAGNGEGGSSGVGSGDGGPAASVQLGYPSSVAADNSGNVFIADSNRIRRVSPDGMITTVAGNGTKGFSGDGGPAVNAQLQDPAALVLDGAGNLFFGDSDGKRVRRVSASGVITTVAGNGLPDFPQGLVDGGPATSTALGGYIGGLAVDQAGDLFISDAANFRVRKVSPDGIIHTVAGGGTDIGEGGPATKALLTPRGIVVDGGGNLLIADVGYTRIRKVTPAGIITTIAGSGATSGPSGDGGPAIGARLSGPVGLALDKAGNLFIADPGLDFLTGGEEGTQFCCDHQIRKITLDGLIATVAGSGTPGFSVNGGPASTASLNGPLSVAVDGSGNVYVADSVNSVVRVLRPTGLSLLIGAVVDAASQRAGPVSPGKIVVIYGAGLGPAQLVQSSSGAPSTMLSGTTVSFNGMAAPILYTSVTQMAAVVPYGITGTRAQVVVTYQGPASNNYTVTGAASAPSLFTANQQGWGQAAAIHPADGAVNTAANPIHIGGYISLFATGEGQTSPPGVDGRLGSATPTAAVLPVRVTVGGIPATVQYAGSVQGQVAGLMQVNVKIPDGVQPGGYVPVVLQVGDASATPGMVWIAVSGN
jgi:uncharacterized protein (TIGR03437 family)